MDELRSRQVLNDAKEAIQRFKNSSDDLNRRLNWILSLTLLRATGHTLSEVDFKSYPKIEGISNWNSDQKLIEINATIKERCASIKRYEINFDWVPESIEDEDGNFIDSFETLQYTGENYYPGCPADSFLEIIANYWDDYLKKFEKAQSKT